MAKLLYCQTRQAKKSSQVVILLFVQYGIEFDPSQIGTFKVIPVLVSDHSWENQLLILIPKIWE